MCTRLSKQKAKKNNRTKLRAKHGSLNSVVPSQNGKFRMKAKKKKRANTCSLLRCLYRIERKDNETGNYKQRPALKQESERDNNKRQKQKQQQQRKKKKKHTHKRRRRRRRRKAGILTLQHREQSQACSQERNSQARSIGNTLSSSKRKAVPPFV